MTIASKLTLPSILAALILISPFSDALAQESCPPAYTGSVDQDAGTYVFKLVPPISYSGGDVVFQYWRDDTLHWDASGSFGCSNGAVQCYLELPYLIGGTPQDPLEIETTFFKDSNDGNLVLFSHLTPKLYNAFRWQDTSLDGAYKNLTLMGEIYVPNTEDDNFVILPEVFTQQNCAQ